MLFYDSQYGTDFKVIAMRPTYNQLLDEHGLADTGTTEETNLTTTGVGGKQVDDLDTSDEDFGRGGLLCERRGVGVDRSELLGLDRTALIDGVTSDVHDTAEGLWTDGDLDGRTGVVSGSTTGQTLGTWSSQQVKLERENTRVDDTYRP